MRLWYYACGFAAAAPVFLWIGSLMGASVQFREDEARVLDAEQRASDAEAACAYLRRERGLA
jgi:hypothetical protein